ncbi:DUF2853 family protein [Granulicoccus phenolivorans]|uniref:DUF2853 family protein n=1 Tax=Granulicoccus phenolivorans TaxID=266854 RepID=UPI0004051578|nr:DUF2853 family protein [Granulicoccus phenolivorans]
MADWAADVKKYVPDANEQAIDGIIKHCGIALRNQDSSLVSFKDKAETDRVKNGFLKKKLEVTDPEVADAALAAVAEKLKSAHRKNRVTVYYLLADHFGKLDLFVKKAK